MGKGIPALEQAYQVLFVASLVVLAVFLVLSFLRAIMGPRVADRIVAVSRGYLPDLCDDKLPGGYRALQGLHGRVPPAEGRKRG